jgi:hypothetical protein
MHDDLIKKKLFKMIKSIFKTVLVLFTLFTVGCTDKKNQETIDYYLSQPRDSELLGWWKYDTENDSVFWYFKEAGTIGVLHMDGETSDYSESRYYWYTEKNDRKILHYFHPYGGLYASEYSHDYYEIKNDSLWVSSGIEGDKYYRSELNPFMAKTTAPKGYEHVK